METVFRKEIKYLISRREAMILQQKLDGIMERDIHGDNGRYFIRSQYYDSIDDQDLWDNLDGMYEKCIHIPQSPLRREAYLRIRRFLTGNRTAGASSEEERNIVLTAERVYHALMEMALPERRLRQLQAEFHLDDHDLWEQEMTRL